MLYHLVPGKKRVFKSLNMFKKIKLLFVKEINFLTLGMKVYCSSVKHYLCTAPLTAETQHINRLILPRYSMIWNVPGK